MVAGFEQVRADFEALAAGDPDYCAQFTAYLGSEPVVDLTCGPWAEDALLPVFSCSKGAIGAVIALLVQRRELDLDAPVASYWPEFGAAGKDSVTVRQMLSHQAGLPTVDGGYTGTELLAHDPLARRLAAQRPFWRPGAGFGYHALTIGVLADELVRQITGRTLAETFREDVAGPRDIDFHLGTPTELDDRVVAVDLPWVEGQPGVVVEIPAAPLDSLRALLGPIDTAPLWTWANEEGPRRVGFPAAGGLATARGLARMYASFGHELGQPRLVDEDVVAQMSQVQVQGKDMLSGLPFRFGILFQRPEPPRFTYGSFLAFGHDGLGGCLGVSDPYYELSFGYTVKRIPMPGGVDSRSLELMKVVRSCAR